MLQSEAVICRRILQRLLKFPCAALFCDFNHELTDDMSTTPQSLTAVAERLEKRHYRNCIALAGDVRTLLHHGVSPDNQFEKEAARLLCDEFDRMVRNWLDDDSLLDPIIEIELQIADMKRNRPLAPPPPVDPDSQPRAEIFRNQPDPITPAFLRRELGLLGSTERISKGIALIKQLQPEAIMYDATITVSFQILTEENRVLAHEGLRKLLLAAAFEDGGRP
jgi:hypothetical protein